MIVRSILLALLVSVAEPQSESPVGTFNLSFQPRAEVMFAKLTIAQRDSGYRASIVMRQLRRTVTSDSVTVVDRRVRVYLPSEMADLTFEFGLDHPRDDTFLVHLDDGDMRGPLTVVREKPSPSR